MITLEPYPAVRPGYTVPEFGGRLNGTEEDAAMLSAIAAEARATQSMHREMVQHMVDWETREPGRLNTDDDLRNAFIENLEGLRSAFTDRALAAAGVAFPMLLDRANPAHAVIIAVRDDIADTRDRLQAKQAQYLLGKQIAEVKISLPEFVVKTAAQTAKEAAEALRIGAQAGGKAVENFATTLAWVLGGGAALYALSQFGRSK